MGVTGETAGEEGARVWRADLEGSLTWDTVSATEMGRSLRVAVRRWECGEDDEGEIVLWDSRGWSKDRLPEPVRDREWRRSSTLLPEVEGKPTALE